MFIISERICGKSESFQSVIVPNFNDFILPKYEALQKKMKLISRIIHIGIPIQDLRTLSAHK